MNDPDRIAPGDDLAHIGRTRSLTSHPPSTEGSPFPLEIVQGPARSDLGTLVVPGLVRNLSDRWVAVSLRVHLYDGGGRELNATLSTGRPFTATPLNFTLPPFGSGPFLGVTDESDVEGLAASCRLTVYSCEEARRRPRAELRDVVIELGDDARATGLYVNTGNEDCLYPSVVGAGYTADGALFTADVTALGDDEGNALPALPPGQARPFVFSFSTLLETGMLTRLELVPGYDSKTV
ncbi:MAG: hypothetical protein KA419_10825 [Acidobacteria bacterium]|nr:hypothetical protein [Acidobacteriota bacterium]